jgi:phospholipid transport system substrate-binding protein
MHETPSNLRSAMVSIRRVAILLSAAALASATIPTDAGAADRAVIEVRTLSASLLKSMRAGRAESMTERYRDLKAVIEEVFALPLMTRLSVGPNWVKFQPQQQQALVSAFSRFTVANYAHNFRSFDGEKFQVDENVVRRGPEEVVRAQIIPPNDTPANLLYLMVKVDGSWRIVDVYYNGISQLALHRADFASAVGSGGAAALIAHLNKVSDDLMK